MIRHANAAPTSRQSRPGCYEIHDHEQNRLRFEQFVDVLRSRSQIEADLLYELGELIAEAAPGSDAGWLRQAIGCLCDAFDREIALENEAGYLSVVLDEMQNWDSKVERLQAYRGLFMGFVMSVQCGRCVVLGDCRCVAAPSP